MRTILRAFLRYLIRRKMLSLLQLMGISFGVACVMGMHLSAKSAIYGFSKSVDFLKGRSTHTIRRPSGPMDESILKGLMVDDAVVAFAPVIERMVRLQDGEMIRLMGIDPFLERIIRPGFSIFHWKLDKTPISFLLDEMGVIVDEKMARRLAIKEGDEISTSHGKFIVEGISSVIFPESIILIDIGNAQRLFGIKGKIDRVDLIVSDERGFLSRWEKGFLIQSREMEKASLTEMLKSFRLNLEALSLLALFVGIFLIYNTAMFAVVSRKMDAGIMRGLGATRWEIFMAFTLEIQILSLAGGAIGGVMGYLLSSFLIGIMGDTISNLYFFLVPSPPGWSWMIPVSGAFLGSIAGFLGGIFPLMELMRKEPIEAIHGRVVERNRARKEWKAAILGIIIIFISIFLLKYGKANIYIGFAGAFLLIVGTGLMTGIFIVTVCPFIKWIFQKIAGLPGMLGALNIARNLERTSVAVCAFMVALSMSIGLGSMIGSFRETLLWWMDSQLRGDLYIAVPQEIEVPEDFYEEIKSIPGIGGIYPHRFTKIVYEGKTVYIRALDASVFKKYTRFGWLKGKNENWEGVKMGGVIVSESFFRRFGKGPGQIIALKGTRGEVHLPVVGVFYDYTTEHGVITMDRSTYIKVFEDRTIDGLGIFMDHENPHSQEILRDIRERAKKRGLPVSTRDDLHKGILEIFDTTFAITHSMRIIAVIVAFFGIAGAILTIFMERQKEFGIYRAIGFSQYEVAIMTIVEAMAMGIISLLMSIVLGTVLTFVLIKVINLQSFNWTIFYHFSPKPYIIAGEISILSSLGSAIYPIWRLFRIYPQIQIREQ